jgi:hypothetical protein
VFVPDRGTSFDEAVEAASAALDAGAGIAALERLRGAFTKPTDEND